MPTTITVKLNGPYLVDGTDIRLVDHEGNEIPTTPGKKFNLCRCGASSKKPFCDATHTRIGFRAAEEARRDFDEKTGEPPKP